jgi:DNA-directed RNA polymerase subunit beta'
MSKVKILKPNFTEVVIGLSSPENILSRSFGEVTEPETKNYRTYKSEERGLFCQRIFGPEEDWKCSCGKYKEIKYRGNICDRCGVEINERKVRRQRMGHIRLAIPIVHTWFFRYHPNVIAALLGISSKKLESVIYYASYIVIHPGAKRQEGIEKFDFLSPKEYYKHLESLPNNDFLSDKDPDKFIAKMGGEAIKDLLAELDIEALSLQLRDKIENETSQQRRADAIKRLKVVESFLAARANGVPNKPEWMVLNYLPVISPEYRPMLALSNGRFATSDMTENLKLVIIRNNRLRKLIEIKAPEIVVLNEKRMLQEVIDALFDNSPRMNTLSTESGRPLKSIGDSLKGKSGLFRSNLLGKRVDYSGRSVITVGPRLKLHQCGLPKEMALILFEPFVIQRLKQRGIIRTFKEGRKLIGSKAPVIWQALENVTRSHPVLLNRAPTLHRLGIQAFYPKLIEGKSIQLHPLVCAAFNADFDGDQMAVHVPLSQEAIAEADLLLLSLRNLLNPSNGEPIAVPTKDMVLGLYYLTKGRKSTEEHVVSGEGIIFSDAKEAIIAINNRQVSKHAYVKLRITKEDGTREIIDTVAGRIIFNQYVPVELGFINDIISSKNIQHIVREAYEKTSVERMACFLDDMKQLGFEQAYKGGLTFGVDDVRAPKEKQEIISVAEEEIDQINESYHTGFITDTERYNQTIDTWSRVGMDITKALLNDLESHKQGFNTIFMMMDSGARGSKGQIKQLCGLRGLMSKPQKLSNNKGSIMEQPILSSLNEGLSVLDFFYSTHGSRKGLSDTAIKTSESGYFNRKLIDCAQGEVITEKDCYTLRGRIVTPIYVRGNLKASLGSQVLNRVTAQDVFFPKNKSVLIKRDTEITPDLAEKIDSLGIPFIQVRSPMHCETENGVCIRCYGTNLGSKRTALIGDAIGNIAAQSVSEPGTQLTLRTFHAGGAVIGSIVEDSIKAIEKGTVQLSNLQTIDIDGKMLIINRSAELKVIGEKAQQEIQSHILPYGSTLMVQEGTMVTKGDVLFEWDPYRIPILATKSGKVFFDGIEEGVTYREEYNEQTGYKEKIIIDSQDKHKVPNIIIEDHKGERTSYTIPVQGQLSVQAGEEIKAGTVLAKLDRPKNRPQDIVGGLPQVTKLFEVQSSSNRAIIAAIEGYVSLGMRRRGKLEVSVKAPNGYTEKYMVPLAKQLLVQDGDYIRSGQLLSDGPLSPKDVLRVKGKDAFCNHIIREVQAVYKLQGVKIADKHLEVILRQMLKKLVVVTPGDTRFIPDQLVHKTQFDETNKRILQQSVILNPGDTRFAKGELVTKTDLLIENNLAENKGLKPAKVRPAKSAIAELKAQGITSSSVTSDSFISAASFQETIKTLVKATIAGKVDKLRGIKENVVVGKLFPAGTGVPVYDKMRVVSRTVEAKLTSSQELSE